MVYAYQTPLDKVASARKEQQDLIVLKVSVTETTIVFRSEKSFTQTFNVDRYVLTWIFKVFFSDLWLYIFGVNIYFTTLIIYIGSIYCLIIDVTNSSPLPGVVNASSLKIDAPKFDNFFGYLNKTVCYQTTICNVLLPFTGIATKP